MLKKIIQKRKLQKKYKRELGWDEKLVHFAVKIVGSTALFFIIAAGVDAYHLFH